MEYGKRDYELEQLAKELVQMHKDTAIDLSDWPRALTIVRRYFRVKTQLEFTEVASLLEKEKMKHGLNEKYKHRPNC